MFSHHHHHHGYYGAAAGFGLGLATYGLFAPRTVCYPQPSAPPAYYYRS